MGAIDDLDLQALLKLGFDPRALRDKYHAERDKRLRPEGNKQYLKTAGQFARYLEHDFAHGPYTSERADRQSLDKAVDVVIIGAGFTGLQVAAKLRADGVDDFLFVERAPDFGGNWWWNRYPGAACDSESYGYFPLLDETGYVPSERYPDAQEIAEHAQRIGRHFGLYEQALFGTSVTGMTWNDETSRWTVRTDRGDALRAKFVVLASGETYAGIKLPGIPGIESFKGHSFHSQHWDYGYTGGGVRGGLDKLADKRVAIIGVGCSGVQIIPHLGASAEHLYVFQRTPAFVDPRQNQPTDPAWASSLQPGWHERRMWQMMENLEGKPGFEPLNDSGFADLAIALRELSATTAAAAEEAGIELTAAELMELANMRYMEGVRERVAAAVRDPATAEALKPYYHSLCKRATWSDEYYPTFNRPNVTLVDCSQGVERITEKGLVANGVEYEVDLIVYASGLEVTHSSVFEIVRFPIVGRGGVTLEEHWTDSYRNLHGIMLHHFPNYFQITVIGSGIGANYLFGSGRQATHVSSIIARCLEQGITAAEPTRAAEDEWRRALDESNDAAVNPRMGAFLQVLGGCTPGYLNNEGDLKDIKGLFANVYGGGNRAYLQLLQDWRDTGDMDGLALTRAPRVG